MQKVQRINTYQKVLAQKQAKTPHLLYVATITALNDALKEDEGKQIRYTFHYRDDLETENERLVIVKDYVHRIMLGIHRDDLRPTLFDGPKLKGIALDKDYSIKITVEEVGGN